MAEVDAVAAALSNLSIGAGGTPDSAPDSDPGSDDLNNMARLILEAKVLLAEAGVKHTKTPRGVNYLKEMGWLANNEEAPLPLRARASDLASRMRAENESVRDFIATINARKFDIALLNGFLNNFTMDAVTSITKAKALLRKININIYDFKDGKYGKTHSTVGKLASYSISRGLIFPLKIAKKGNIRIFLRELSGGGRRGGSRRQRKGPGKGAAPTS